MRRVDPRRAAVIALVALVLAAGCGGDDNPTKPPTNDNLPPVPVPTSVDQLMPAKSADLVIGTSDPLDRFVPVVLSLQQMLDDGSLVWSTQNRHLVLACDSGVLPAITAQAGAADATYITARPRLQHSRHWRRIQQNSLSPGTGYTLTQTVSWGASTYHEENLSFSTTIGVTTTVGGSWEGFSAEVSASFSQTTTHGEVNGVSFTSEQSEERSYYVEAPASGTRIYVLWQLVDVFTMVDADGVPIDQSPTLAHATIQPIPPIEFPNEDVFVLKTTDFPN